MKWIIVAEIMVVEEVDEATMAATQVVNVCVYIDLICLVTFCF